MGSNVGIDAMPFAIRSQCKGLNVDETVGRFVWKPKITRRPVCARASYDRRNVATCVEIKILRRVLNLRVILHAIDATSARPSQNGHVIAEK